MTAYYGALKVEAVYVRTGSSTSTVIIEDKGMYIEWETPFDPPEIGSTVFVSIQPSGNEPDHHLGGPDE